MLHQFRFRTVLLAIAFFGTIASVYAQKKTAFVQFYGSTKSNSKNINGVTIDVFENGSVVQNLQSADNGSFIVMMDLNKQFLLVFSKSGYIPKSIQVNSAVPPDAADIGYAFKANVELYEDIGGGAAKADPMSKPTAILHYDATYDDFDFDPVYTKRIQQEQQDALKAAAEAKRDAERARLDSLNKAWNDSIAKNRVRDSTMLAQRNALEKAKQDSILRAQAAAAALAAAEKAKNDSIARAEAEKKRLDELARNKAVADSIASAKAQAAALAKARQDSIAKATLAEKAHLDSLNKAEAERKRLDELAQKKAREDSIALAQANLKKKQDEEKARLAAEAKERARLDSIAKADVAAAKLAEQARQKAAADSSARAQARQKEIADSTSKANAAEATRQKALADAQAKATVDSLAKAKADAAEARKKFVADSTTQAMADKAREKSRQDSITRAEANARALAEARKKAEADSIASAEVERQKQEALAKVKAEEEAKAKEDAEQQKLLLAERARQDSIAALQRAQKEKEDADKKAAIAAEIQARKDALAKANTYEKTERTPSIAIPKIKESDYNEGITDEKITESNRSIERTVIKREGVTNNYQKITYNWEIGRAHV